MKLTIIGTGYVGLVTGTCFAEMGNKVYCVDIDEKKINDLKNNIMPIYEPNLDTLVRENQEKHDLIFTTDLKEALDDSNIIFLAVGTPMREDGSANLDYIYSAADNIGNNISKDSLVVIKSTVPIGTAFKVKEHIEEIFKLIIASDPILTLQEYLYKFNIIDNKLIAKQYGRKIVNFLNNCPQLVDIYSKEITSILKIEIFNRNVDLIQEIIANFPNKSIAKEIQSIITVMNMNVTSRKEQQSINPEITNEQEETHGISR